MAKDGKPPSEKEHLDEHGLDPDVRRRILSYGAPDRRKADAKVKPEMPKGKRRDDHPQSPSR